MYPVLLLVIQFTVFMLGFRLTWLFSQSHSPQAFLSVGCSIRAFSSAWELYVKKTLCKWESQHASNYELIEAEIQWMCPKLNQIFEFLFQINMTSQLFSVGLREWGFISSGVSGRRICLKCRVKGDGRREKRRSAGGKVRQAEIRDRAGTQKTDTFTPASSCELTERVAVNGHVYLHWESTGALRTNNTY